MSFMEYESPRSCLSHNISYPNYLYDERHAQSTLDHTRRENPRSYPIGGPVGGLHARTVVGRGDPVIETGPARRRISVACARCRKRKIRCSGDPGNGSGCLNCRQAGVDPINCQFHRVGSDAVHKVIDNMAIAHNLSHLANGQQMIPVYQTGSTNPLYQRPMPVPQYPQYPQLDTKSACTPIWAVPYSEDASPVESFSMDQQSSFIPNSTAMANSSICSSYRGNDPAVRTLHHGGACFDQGPFHGLPFTTSDGQINSSDISPLDTSMSSLHLSLPDRSPSRQTRLSELSVPRRQLPMPQPSPAQSGRNIVDQMQDARLRSAQASGSSVMDSRGSFSKPIIPWIVDGGNQANVSGVSSGNGSAQLVPHTRLQDTTESSVSYMPTIGTTADDVATTSTTSQFDLNFSTSGLLGGMSASAQVTPYSYVRASPTMLPTDPQVNAYSTSESHPTKRNSSGVDASNDCALNNGRRYPRNHSSSQSSPKSHKTPRDSQSSRNVRLQRTSAGSLNATY
ncbi:hypothetical protein yc1106_06467 [Curvularia clavata]|uniref:Zn(2)-C6 fungal-type domain-containing protein n=1 Tax=Curvularia clavata TaxID=95742 RepID=A0A9Q9DSY6_CURCL|nr:hypothetical protein yc1106_06467 [Curvularia clavata]